VDYTSRNPWGNPQYFTSTLDRCTFVDEIVVHTRLRAPLIGVQYWSEVLLVVKKDIIKSVMVSQCPPHAP
jgi:hypothetical protein